jgi:tetratricopeptide (TPR) repeat protein
VDLTAAQLHLAAGDTAAARSLLLGVVGTCRDERPFLAARALAALGRLDRTAGRLDTAETHLREALTLFQAAGESLGEANVLVELADVARDAGRRESTRALLGGALATYRRHGTSDGVARVLLRRGLVAADTGDLPLARGDLAAAAKIFHKHALRHDEGHARNRLGWVLAALGQPAAADRELAAALRLLADDPAARVGTLLARARVAEAAGRTRSAGRWREAAKRAASEGGIDLDEE